jgi:cobalt/nickel transport system permease protein
MSGAHLLRSYAYLDSPIHRAPAVAKMLAAFVVVVGVALVPVRDAGWTAAVFVASIGLARAARVPLGAFVARIAIAEPFVLGIAILSLFQDRGLAAFASVALKSTACVAVVQLLAHTTPFQDILAVLRRAKVPPVLVVTIGLLHRYGFVLVEETRRMQRARAARTWSTRRWDNYGALASAIAVSFVRSVARAERIHVAMRARGGAP